MRPSLKRLGLALGGAATVTGALTLAAPSTATRAAPLSGIVVAIDPGHNGANGRHPEQINRTVDAGGGVRKACDTTGTQTNDGRLTEAAFNFDVATRLASRLRALGARVVLTRTTNSGVGPCITRRAAIGNEVRADVAISIHADGGPPGGRGFHVIRPAGIKGQSSVMLERSDLFGRRVRAALRARGYRTATYIGVNGLDRRADLGGLNLSTVPKVFVELGNMRNAQDAALLKASRHRARMADALAEAVRAQTTRR